MSEFHILVGAAALALGLVSLPEARAAQTTFDFGSLTPTGGQNLGTNTPVTTLGTGSAIVYYNAATETFTTGGYTVKATAFNTLSTNLGAGDNETLTQANLTGFGADEAGLGAHIASDPANNVESTREINKTSFVTLDYSQVLAAGGGIVSISIGSNQGQEGYSIWGSNTQPTTAALATSGFLIGACLTPAAPCGGTPTTVNLATGADQFKFITVSAYQGAGTNSSDDITIGTTVISPTRIPEPASMTLFAFGLAGLAAARRKPVA